MWFGFQFNLSDSSDDDLYRLDLEHITMSMVIAKTCENKKANYFELSSRPNL